MSYVIKAVLSNPQCPGYGLVTVPFPIPDQEYDHMMELLSGLKIGDALEQDCRVDELDSWYDVLNVLNGTSVNVDELDYLAKRLDSFCEDEGAQFQAMAHKLGLSNIQDFINLTFCCQQATVITNFSDLEAVGRSHYMNLHGGSALTEELENLDGVETALLLIDGGGEAVTPYGVVYDNGMKLERLYDGQHFPAYFYDVHPLALEITQDSNGSREYLYFPTSSKKIERTLLRAGADLRFAPACHDLPEQTAFAMDLDHLEAKDLPALNRICQLIKAMPPLERKKLDAAVMMTMPHGADEVCRLAENLGQFDFVPGVKTPEEYGRYMIRESGNFEYDENLEGFYNFLAYGLQQTEKEQGQFNTLGYISYHGDLTLDELPREAPAKQCQREQGPQMGGPVVMEVYLSRNHQTCLHLFPLSTGKFQDVFNQPNGPDGRSPRLVIERFISPLEELDRSLKGMALRSLSDVSQLNELVEGVERMGERDRQILSGALRAEHVKCLADVYRTVQNISDYKLIGGVFTPDGYVQRKKDLPKLERDAVLCLTLATAEQSDTLLLPASEKQIEDAERTLGDLDRTVIAAVEFKLPYLKNLIPTDHVTVKEAQALANCLQGMAEEEDAMLTYCSALAVEKPASFAEALNIAMNICEYERVPEDLAEYAEVNLRLAGAGDEILGMLAGFTDFRKLGEAIAKQEGVRQTIYGSVRRLSEPFPAEDIGQTMY